MLCGTGKVKVRTLYCSNWTFWALLIYSSAYRNLFLAHLVKWIVASDTLIFCKACKLYRLRFINKLSNGLHGLNPKPEKSNTTRSAGKTNWLFISSFGNIGRIILFTQCSCFCNRSPAWRDLERIFVCMGKYTLQFYIGSLNRIVISTWKTSMCTPKIETLIR